MILSRVLMDRFRALHSVNAELKPLTVLVGANDTGKSSFLAALASLFDSRVGGTAVELDDFYRGERSSSAPLVRGWSGPNAGIQRITDGLVGMYQLPSTGIPMVSEGLAENPLRPFPELGRHGEGVATLLDSLLRRDRVRFDRITQRLRELVPGLEDILIGTPTSNTRSLSLVIENGLTIPADRTSTGLRMMLFFVALAFHPEPPDLILLEEPENGVHPRRLGAIVDLLRSITKGEQGGHAAQIVLTTHSPYLLDAIDLNQDQVLVFQRESDGRRTAVAADGSRLAKFLNEFQLGEVWYNEGERGLIASK